MDSEPAFPVTREELVSYADGKGQVPLPVSYSGLTKREWFAGQALAVLACDYGPDEIGAKCLQYADALIAALETK